MSAAVIVALGILGTFVILSAITLFRFSADEAMKVLGVFTGIFGLIFGAMGTYFFTRTEVTAARTEATAARNIVAQYKSQLGTAAQVVATIDSKPTSYTLAQLKDDQGYQKAVMHLKAADAKFDQWSYDGTNEKQNNEKN